MLILLYYHNIYFSLIDGEGYHKIMSLKRAGCNIMVNSRLLKSP